MLEQVHLAMAEFYKKYLHQTVFHLQVITLFTFTCRFTKNKFAHFPISFWLVMIYSATLKTDLTLFEKLFCF